MRETLALNGFNKWMPVGENLKNYCFWNLPKLAQNPVTAQNYKTINATCLHAFYTKQLLNKTIDSCHLKMLEEM